MAKFQRKVGSTSKTVNVWIQDSSSTLGAGLAGLVYNSAGLTACYMLPRAAAVSITLATLAAVTSAYSSGGFKEIDATLAPGWYRFDIPDAALASGEFVSIHLKGATNMAPLPIEIELTALDNQDAVRGGMTALPNAAAEAAGGLYTRGTGAGQINQAANGMVDTNPVRLNNVAQSLLDLKDFADDGYDPATNKVQGVVLTDTVTTYTGNTPQTGDNFARIGAPVGASISADVAAVKAQAVTINADTDDIQTRLPAALVSGRMDSSVGVMAANTLTASALATDAVNEISDQVWDEAIAGHAGAGSTGAALSAAGSAGDPWSTALPGAYGAGTAGKIVGDNITGNAFTRLGAPVGASISVDVAAVKAQVVTINADTDDIQTRLPAALVSGRMDSSVGSYPGNTAQTGDNFARLGAPAGASVSADVAAVKAETASIQADTNDIQTRIPAALVSGRIDASVGAMAASTVTASALATDAVAEIADGVWDEAIAGHLGAGSTGLALSSAGAAGDPWNTGLPGAYGAGSAGFILGTNLDATIGSRASQASLDTLDDFVDTEVLAIKAKTDNIPPDPADASDIAASFATVNTKLDTIDDFLDTEVAAIKAKTDTIPTSPSAVGSAMTLTSGERTSIADALLARALAAESYAADGAVPTLSQALYMLLSEVGEFSITGTTLTCKKLDGSTTAMTFTLDSATAPTSRTRAT